jgi:hypothetical protein
MEVVDVTSGRLGNAIFRYLASSLFCILYNGSRKTTTHRYAHIITDEYFIDWKRNVENEKIPPMPTAAVCKFSGFFQHDKIYQLYMSKLKEFMYSNPDHTVNTDDDNTYSVTKLMEPWKGVQYDTVLHLRLEDFISHGLVINPNCFITLFNSIKPKGLCIVMKRPSTELEHNYLKYILKYVECSIESNDVVTDFCIMRNAKTLICSNSTLSWAAALLSDTITTVYMPNYKQRFIHETIRTPHLNTVTFEIEICSSAELNTLFKNK